MTSVDPTTFREALGRFATGVTVVTAVDALGLPVGMTVSAFSSLSLEPPLILVCIGREAKSLEAISGAPWFAVNILAEGQKGLSYRFAAKAGDKFEGLDWQPGEGGSPLLAGCIAILECRHHRLFEGGDHVILTGRVERVRTAEGDPLLYFRGAYAEKGRDL